MLSKRNLAPIDWRILSDEGARSDQGQTKSRSGLKENRKEVSPETERIGL
jgi:hypothetical protein